MFNLKKKVGESINKEFYYGAKINKNIIDVYIGMGYLEARETNKKIGPSRNHEEILYLSEGQVKLEIKNEELIMSEGEVFYMPDGQRISISNLTDKKIHYMIAGGHTELHKH